MVPLPCEILFLLSLFSSIAAQLSNDPESLLNWCLDSKNHKSKPGPEDELHNQCLPWKERACCTSNTTKNLHVRSLYKFNYNHCSLHRNMSELCRKHFIQDECFFECSPNIGPWVVKVAMKTRNERFFEVPLCASDCEVWFDACKDDYTCSEKWINNNIMQDGLLTPCHDQSECKKISEIFQTSKNFCEKVWDHSWKYTNDTEVCMRIWFDGSKGNPNDKVAKYYTEHIFGSNSVLISPFLSLVVVGTIFVSTGMILA